MTLEKYLSGLVDGGKIESFAFGHAYLPIYDLNGKKSLKFGIQHYAQIIHLQNNKRQTLQFDGATEQQVIEQVAEYFKNISGNVCLFQICNISLCQQKKITMSSNIKMPSNLSGKSISECIEIAEDIASETFIKNGNKAISFTDNKELRLSLGGKYDSYKELAEIMIGAYNSKQTSLILSNL